LRSVIVVGQIIYTDTVRTVAGVRDHIFLKSQQQSVGTRFLNFKHLVEGFLFLYLWSFLLLVPAVDKLANRFDTPQDYLWRWTI
jgi:hypothetical protein